MGFLTYFGKSPESRGLPSGSFTVNRNGEVLASTVSSTVGREVLREIAREVLQTLKQVKDADSTISEFSIRMGNINIKARDLQGGAIIFLSPPSDSRN